MGICAHGCSETTVATQQNTENGRLELCVGSVFWHIYRALLFRISLGRYTCVMTKSHIGLGICRKVPRVLVCALLNPRSSHLESGHSSQNGLRWVSLVPTVYHRHCNEQYCHHPCHAQSQEGVGPVRLLSPKYVSQIQLDPAYSFSVA